MIGQSVLLLVMGASITIPFVIALHKIVHYIFESFCERKREKIAKEQAQAARTRAQSTQTFVRHEDILELTNDQLKQKEYAEQLVGQGKAKEAAAIYRALTLDRAAIQTLEDAGLIREACAILFDKKLPNRAGFLCLRNGWFPEAAECFSIAKMPSESADAYVRASAKNYRYFQNAANAYETAGKTMEAIDAYEQIMLLDTAAKLAIQTNAHERLLRLALNRNFWTEVTSISTTEIWKSILQGQSLTPKNAHDMGAIFSEQFNKQDIFLVLNRFGSDALLYRSFLCGLGTININKTIELYLESDLSSIKNHAHAVSAALVDLQKNDLAAVVYEKIHAHPDAARAYLKGGNFEKARAMIVEAGHPEIAKNLEDIAAQYTANVGALGEQQSAAKFWEDANSVLKALS